MPLIIKASIVKAELKTSEENMVATVVFYQSDKLFPSKLTTNMDISVSSDPEQESKSEAYRDLARNLSESSMNGAMQVLEV